MRTKPGRTAIIAALTASLAFSPLPAAAAAVPSAWDAAVAPIGLDAVAGHSRRYRDRDDGIDAGGIIAGILVLGAVAAAAGAFDGDRDEPRHYPADDRRPDERAESSGLSRAVDMCVAEVERGGERVNEVHTSTRNAQGWHVGGNVGSGRSFSCHIDNDGRIRGVDLGGRYDAYAPAGEDRQYADSVYARLRSGRDGPAAPGERTFSTESYGPSQQPAYPGGPLPGEEGYEDYRPSYEPRG